MEQAREKLYIPANVKTKTEFFPGIGMQEIIKALTTAALCSGFCLVIFLLNNSTTFIIVAVIVSAALGLTIHRKDENNISIADQIGFMVRFMRSQKELHYRYGKEW